VRLTPALHLGPLALVIVAACDKTEPSGSTSSAPPPTPTVVTTASVTATASAPPPDALPSADPPTVHTSAPTASATASAKPATSAKPDAGAKPPKVASSAAPDAGAADGGAVAAIDAGAPNPALAVAKQVDAIFASAKTFSARFKQQYYIKVYNKTETSTGVVFIERPSKISFRYDPPNDNRIVSDGTTIKIYQAADKQMTEMPMAKTAFPGALAFMLGSGISQSFDFAINPKAQWSGGVVLDGKPLTPTTSYQLAMFYIDQALLQKADPNAVKRVLIIDAQENKNRFDFENVTQPASINPAEFNFTPPPGTDIKRQ
jgi:outer membrane lipoprotein carrier protein